jgi:hypothetical protein
VRAAEIDTSSSPGPDRALAQDAGGKACGRRRSSDAISNVTRRAVEKRAYAVRDDNSVLDLRVVDLSYDGCAVETIEPLVPGELLKLTMLGGLVVTATVRWYRDRRAGLLFDPDQFPSTYRPRLAERHHVAARASLRRSGRPSYPVSTFDLSAMGCKCEFIERPSIGERVWVTFVGLQPLEAEVSWLAESNLGLKFRTPIHPAVFELLLEKLQT